ncbi:hypothetical protein C8T65DRAFT_97579 [Cerioporus squamosus]|nr:hypothetical protein C8T65DRAFT_97579 [Cerioporus squamosus]
MCRSLPGSSASRSNGFQAHHAATYSALFATTTTFPSLSCTRPAIPPSLTTLPPPKHLMTMAGRETTKTVRWVDQNRVHIFHSQPTVEHDEQDASSWTSASDSGTHAARTNDEASTPPRTSTNVYAASEGASGSGNGAFGNTYDVPVVSQRPYEGKKPQLHPYLEECPHQFNVRPREADFGVGENVLAQHAFLDVDPPTMTLRFDALDGLTWTHTIERRPHGENGCLGSYISVRDVINAIWLQLRRDGRLERSHRAHSHAKEAMRARDSDTMRRMDWFALWHGRLFFQGIEPQPGAAGWEFVVRLVPRLPPA